MSARDRLPSRRRNVTQEFFFSGQVFTVCIGFDDAGEPREVFADGQREGSQLQAFIDDCCVVLSLALQHGVAASALAHSLGTVPVWQNGVEGVEHCSPIGAICEVLILAREAPLVWKQGGDDARA